MKGIRINVGTEGLDALWLVVLAYIVLRVVGAID